MTINEPALSIRDCERAFNLEDLHIRSGSEGGDGREVEAYAAVWRDKAGKPIHTEVVDQDGHYFETLAPGSFTRTINNRGTGFGVLFNHGRTIDGSPNPFGTMPIGVPLEVRADERGVYTRTRYLDNPLANDVLDAIRQGAIKAQSFSGAFRKSARSRPSGSSLPLITRHEVEMREYGPAVFAAYPDAVILGSRAERFMRSLLATPPDRRLDWLQQFEGFATSEEILNPEIPDSDTPPGPVAQTDDPHSHSARSEEIRARIRAWRDKQPKESQ